jgi:hypothetical protein
VVSLDRTWFWSITALCFKLFNIDHDFFITVQSILRRLIQKRILHVSLILGELPLCAQAFFFSDKDDFGVPNVLGGWQSFSLNKPKGKDLKFSV